MEEINDIHTAYMHISNSGFDFKVEVEDTEVENGATQWLTLGLNAYGLPIETKIWLDDNTLKGLEYIVHKARLQREVYPNLRDRGMRSQEPQLS